jgi:hypothetical protein
MSLSDRPAGQRRRRSVLGVGTAAGAAFAAALISMGTTPAASATTGSDADPLGDLFGTGGTNTWTTMADSTLATSGVAAPLDASVDNVLAAPDADPFTDLANALDPTAFSGGLPVNAIGDFAVGTDYILSLSGAGAALDPTIDSLLPAAPAAAASATTGSDADPLGDLFGTGGTNTWTTMADSTLATSGVAAPLDASVDNVLAAPDADPFTDLANALDPTAFSGGLPVNAIGDFAVGTDYILSLSGAGAALDSLLSGVLPSLF